MKRSFSQRRSSRVKPPIGVHLRDGVLANPPRRAPRRPIRQLDEDPRRSRWSILRATRPRSSLSCTRTMYPPSVQPCRSRDCTPAALGPISSQPVDADDDPLDVRLDLRKLADGPLHVHVDAIPLGVSDRSSVSGEGCPEGRRSVQAGVYRATRTLAAAENVWTAEWTITKRTSAAAAPNPIRRMGSPFTPFLLDLDRLPRSGDGFRPPNRTKPASFLRYGIRPNDILLKSRR